MPKRKTHTRKYRGRKRATLSRTRFSHCTDIKYTTSAVSCYATGSLTSRTQTNAFTQNGSAAQWYWVTFKLGDYLNVQTFSTFESYRLKKVWITLFPTVGTYTGNATTVNSAPLITQVDPWLMLQCDDPGTYNSLANATNAYAQAISLSQVRRFSPLRKKSFNGNPMQFQTLTTIATGGALTQVTTWGKPIRPGKVNSLAQAGQSEYQGFMIVIQSAASTAVNPLSMGIAQVAHVEAYNIVG